MLARWYHLPVYLVRMYLNAGSRLFNCALWAQSAERQAGRLHDSKNSLGNPDEEMRQRNRYIRKARKALQKVKLIDCLRLVKLAEDTADYALVPALCLLLIKPRGFRARLAYNRPLWASMRVRAIHMLRRFADDDAIPYLIFALVYDQPEARKLAALALQDLGTVPFDDLQSAFTSLISWEVEGMCELISAMAATEHPDAARAIAEVLTDKTPSAPDRWVRRHTGASAICGAMFTVILLICVRGLPGNYMSRADLLMLALAGWGTLSILCGLTMAALGTFKGSKADERAILHTRAADALIGMNDTRCVPDLLELLAGRCSRSARDSAEDILKMLLQQINYSDKRIFEDAQGGDRLLNGLLRSQDGALLLEAVLALRYAGTTSAIPALERFVTRKPPRTGSAEFVRARQEAHVLLEALHALKRREEDSQVLLRHADGSSGQATQLVRPATGGNDDPGTLLRPNFVGIKPGGNDSNLNRRR